MITITLLILHLANDNSNSTELKKYKLNRRNYRREFGVAEVDRADRERDRRLFVAVAIGVRAEHVDNDIGVKAGRWRCSGDER